MTGHRRRWIVRHNRRYRRTVFTRWFIEATRRIFAGIRNMDGG